MSGAIIAIAVVAAILLLGFIWYLKKWRDKKILAIGKVASGDIINKSMELEDIEPEHEDATNQDIFKEYGSKHATV